MIQFVDLFTLIVIRCYRLKKWFYFKLYFEYLPQQGRSHKYKQGRDKVVNHFIK